MYENEIRNRFIKELEKLGFPLESIVLEYKIEKKSLKERIDIAIIDHITNNILAIFEVKTLREREKSERKLKTAQGQLEKYLQILGDTQIPAYVILATGEGDYEIHMLQVDTDKEERELIPIAISDIFPYVVLRTGSRSSEKKKISNNIDKETDNFKKICWVLAACSLVIAILDYLQIISISNTQLGLFGVAIALVIIPFSNKLKILGVEFERLEDDRKDIKDE